MSGKSRNSPPAGFSRLDIQYSDRTYPAGEPALSMSNKMSIPRDHHFVPQFYTKQWIGADNELCEFTRPYKALVDRRKSPAATGFKRDLYRIEGVSEEICQSIELGFMRLTDQGAHLILQKLLNERGGSL